MTMSTVSVLLLLLAGFISAQAQEAKPSLVAVFVQLRHGDRAPTDFYPNDPFKDPSYWQPNGIGELNALGIDRMMQAGNLYQEKYKQFLDETKGWPTYAKSSTRNRTIESLRYFLEHFMPDENLNATTMIKLDQKMLTTTYPCDKSNAAWLKEITSKEVMDYIESNKYEIQYLESLTGAYYLNATPYTLRELEFLSSTTDIERDEYHLNVSAWLRNQSTIEAMRDFKKHAYLFDWKPQTVQKYRVGPLLGDIADNIERVVNGSTKQRFYVYSTHDVNQILLLQAMQTYASIGSNPTSYTSAIMFEVYKQTKAGNDTYLLRMLYREVPRIGGTKLPSKYQLKDTPLNITNCVDATVIFDTAPEYLCTFDHFRSIIADLVPENYDEECKSSGRAILPGLLTVLLALLSIFIYSAH